MQKKKKNRIREKQTSIEGSEQKDLNAFLESHLEINETTQQKKSRVLS
jgi:hypothetical protein